MYIIYIYIYFFIKLGNLFVDKCLWGDLGAVLAWLLGRAVAKLLTRYCKHEV